MSQPSPPKVAGLRRKRFGSAASDLAPCPTPTFNPPSSPSPPSISLSRPIKPLTRRNLRIHTASYRPTSTSTMPPSPTKTNATSSSQSIKRVEEQLSLYRIHLERSDNQIPQEISQLKAQWLRPRPTDVTPKSKFLADAQLALSQLAEDEVLTIISEKLFYRQRLFRDDAEGEHTIFRGQNNQWRDVIQPPEGVAPHILESAMEKLGSPSRPKPDFSYGYSDSALPNNLAAVRRALPDHLLVFDREPRFPYLVVEWKASESIAKAHQQARRDTAAAIHTLHGLFERASMNPGPADTCALSLCGNGHMVELRLHWRQLDEDDCPSIHAVKLKSALIYEADQVYSLRSCLLENLEWARGPRLDKIKSALEKLASPNHPLTPPVSFEAFSSTSPTRKQRSKRRRVDENSKERTLQ